MRDNISQVLGACTSTFLTRNVPPSYYVAATRHCYNILEIRTYLVNAHATVGAMLKVVGTTDATKSTFMTMIG
jgi:hypothetical protein